jgi:1-acyl-sn-glycerol-3-phosphate acyltransferase
MTTPPRPGPFARAARALYGLYGWCVFIVCVLAGLLASLLVPWSGLRHWLTAASSRAIFILGGVAPEIHGLEHVPAGDAVAVANHASYVDGFLLKGYLPARFSFVVKGEMRNIPIAHFLLRRAGSRFVERHEAGASARDARLIVKAAKGGQSLAFFPEGTFREEPGVGRFRAGAFVAAIRGGMPILPVAISHTRAMMPSGRNWPWPVRPRIDILPPILPDDPAFADHRQLAETARRQILEVLGEPDLCKVAPRDFNED